MSTTLEEIKENEIENETSPYDSLFRDILSRACELKASDIHIEPTRTGVNIRFRINGDMIIFKNLSLEHRMSFINSVKKFVNLSIAMSGRPQDSRVHIPQLNLDIRVNLLPSLYGEKIVLRLLFKRRFHLDDLKFPNSTRKDLQNALGYSNGLILISGATGSGKTTTLYTLLNSLDKNAKSIVTIENPIEYGVDSITQVQVGEKLSFSSALRAILRQDPDVILVGEIRDQETAQLCFQAASTGHLVLSTIHANNAHEVVGRLIQLGIPSYEIISNLRFSSAQRLIKEICPLCSHLPSNQDIEKFCHYLESAGLSTEEFSDKSKLRIRKIDEEESVKCIQCVDGVIGRIPILEYIEDDEIQNYLNSKMQLPKLLRNSLLKSSAQLCFKGQVCIKEAMYIE